MLEPTRPSATESLSPTAESRGATGSATGGSRSSRRKRGLLRRTGIVLPAFAIAVLLVGIVTVAAYVTHSNGSGASGLAQAIDSLPQSGSVALLEKERQTIIVMDAASKTLSMASKPVMANPSQVMASQQASSSSGTSSSSSSGGGVTTVSAPPPNPGTAQQIGYDMLPQFGFSQKTQWGCLLDLWNRESGWVYDAENASGAYGIPQALPGDKMASAGSDWQTNPATQIKWGLGYISQVYGTPCAAWNNELAYGYY
jgi:hypothetical protein